MSIATSKLLALVNRDNYTNIVESQVAIQAPLVNPDAGIARNTKLTLNAIKGQGFRGNVTVWYNRIDLGVLFKNVGANVGLEVVEGDTTDKLIPLLNAKYGTDFEVADFETLPLVATADPSSTSVVTITPKAANVAYVGSFDVTYGIVEVALDSVVLVTTLTGFNYPNADVSKGQAAIYSYNLDGSTQPENFWASVVTAQPVDATFVVPFNQAYRVDEDWIYSEAEPADYNLFGATVEFAGTVADATTAGFIANPVYTSVVVLKLSETACTNFGGLLTVHFGGQAAV